MDFTTNHKSLIMVLVLMIKILVDGIYSLKGNMKKNLRRLVVANMLNEGNEIRVGRWTELSNGFKDDSQVTQKRRIIKLQKSWQIGFLFENL
ncbi:unnamed protein product [Paramecium primaurelia]|uniref:Uncharacterized protein n=1 Tax=Paramecium primaurelia TaxID=5886 RepID=A0A8S1QGT0_PARPR|nr:unnamed protein product [Paramecium primaurelia]